MIAFEPVWPSLHEDVCRNIQDTINIKAPIFTMPFGLAEQEKTAIVHVPDGRFESGSIRWPDRTSRGRSIRRGRLLDTNVASCPWMDSCVPGMDS